MSNKIMVLALAVILSTTAVFVCFAHNPDPEEDGGEGGGSRRDPCYRDDLNGFGLSSTITEGLVIRYDQTMNGTPYNRMFVAQTESLGGVYNGEFSTEETGTHTYTFYDITDILGFGLRSTVPEGVSYTHNGCVHTFAGAYTVYTANATLTYDLNISITTLYEDLNADNNEIVATSGTYNNSYTHWLGGALESRDTNQGTALPSEACEFSFLKIHREYIAVNSDYNEILRTLARPGSFPLTLSGLRDNPGMIITETGETKEILNVTCKQYTAKNNSNIDAVFYALGNYLISYEGTWYGLETSMQAHQYIPGVHKIVIDPRVEPTCDTPGLTQGKHCSVCGKVIVKQQVLPVIPSVAVTLSGKDFIAVIGDTHYIAKSNIDMMVEKANEDSAYRLIVKAADGSSVTFDNAALKNFPSKDIWFDVEKVRAPSCAPADSTAYSVSVRDCGDLGGGTIKVTIPYDGPRDKMVVRYVDDGKLNGRYAVTFGEGTATFTADTLSTYVLVQESSDVDPTSDDSGSGNNMPLIIGAAIAVVAIIGLAVFLKLR